MSTIGWITAGGAVLLFASLFVAQAADGMRNKGLFDLANVMTLAGAAGLLVGAISWLFG